MHHNLVINCQKVWAIWSDGLSAINPLLPTAFGIYSANKNAMLPEHGITKCILFCILFSDNYILFLQKTFPFREGFFDVIFC